MVNVGGGEWGTGLLHGWNLALAGPPGSADQGSAASVGSPGGLGWILGHLGAARAIVGVSWPRLGRSWGITGDANLRECKVFLSSLKGGSGLYAAP